MWLLDDFADVRLAANYELHGNYVKPELEKQVDKLRGPFSSFIQTQTTASAFLLLALIAALFIANSPYAHELTAIQHLSLRFGIGEYSFEWSLLHLVNDGLIA